MMKNYAIITSMCHFNEVQVCGQYAYTLVEVAFHHAIISHVVTGIAPNGVNNEH